MLRGTSLAFALVLWAAHVAPLGHAYPTYCEWCARLHGARLMGGTPGTRSAHVVRAMLRADAGRGDRAFGLAQKRCVMSFGPPPWLSAAAVHCSDGCGRPAVHVHTTRNWANTLTEALAACRARAQRRPSPQRLGIRSAGVQRYMGQTAWNGKTYGCIQHPAQGDQFAHPSVMDST